MSKEKLKQEPLEAPKEELTVEELPEISGEALEDFISAFDMESFLTDVMLFDYLVKNNGYVEITQEDMDKLEEMRRTRAVEFSSVKDSEGNFALTARFVYRGEGDEKDSDNQ